MSIFDKIKEKPFLLSDSDVQWVKDTLAGMTGETEDRPDFSACAPERAPNRRLRTRSR